VSIDARMRRVEAARGNRPLDLLIQDVKLVNVYTGEVYPAEIGISGGYVAYAGASAWPGPEPHKRLSAQGKFAVPGLIDCHVHIESSMMSPAGFAAAVLPRGTTTVVTDPHEIGNVLGLRGVRYMLQATAKLPLRVYVQVPSCVPAVPGQEVAGAEFGSQEVAEMLTWRRVIGLAEVMDYVGVVQQSQRMRTILDAAAQKGTVISGHCPGLRGQALAAYMMAGPLSDHEAHDPDEILEKLRLGMTFEAKVSSFSESMRAAAGIVKDLGTVPPNLVFCTDDIWPEDLMQAGHMDNVVRHAIAEGMPVIGALRAATLHGAQRHRLFDLGAIAPGKQADILLVPDLEAFEVDEVFVAGELVAQKGRMLGQLPRLTSGVESENNVHLSHTPQKEHFLLHARPGRRTERLRVMTLEPDGSRGMDVVELPVRDGVVDLTEASELAWVAVLERHGRSENRSLSLVRGIGLERGAVASTVAHDSHNLLVVGRSAEDMAVAARELVDCGGGICCAVNGRVAALLPLPIAGLMSPLPLEDLVPLMQKLNHTLRGLGMGFRQPLSPILGLALPVIPHYGITDRGLVDVDRQVVLPIWADEG
jgi:adenine deaminase